MRIKLMFVLVFSIIALGRPADVKDIIKKVQKKYDKMDRFSATFKQIETFKLTGSQSETVGKIFVKGSDKYRFESEDQVIVTDGKSVWTFNAMSRQLLIDNVRENSGALLPRDLLFKYPKKYQSTLLSEEKVDRKTIYTVKLEPKENTRGFIKSIKLRVEKNKWHIRTIETTDYNGNESRFEITDVDTKTKLADDLFSFAAGEGVEIVDMR